MLDLLLLALIFLVATTVRDRWHQAQAREQALLRQMVPVAPAPVIPALDGVKPATAAAYMEVAQQLLFSRDRNPNIILDPPAPPPPPKPWPAFPLAYGVMDLGSGPTIILIEKPGAQHRGYRPGDTIGEFKILALSNQDITFEWEGKQVVKRVEELVDKKAREAPPAQTAAAPSNTPPAPAQPQATNLGPVKAGPGVELSERSRACVPGDKSPAGTVQDGFRKVTNRTPFGESCRWEAVN